MNVKGIDIKQILNNEEIKNIIKIIGLEIGKTYNNINSLRYGKIMIMTDQDHDGSHIKGLIINIFHTLWPSLLKMEYITSMITPIVKVTKGKKQIAFYQKRVSPYGYYPWKQLAKEIFAEHFDDSREDCLHLSRTPSVITNKAFLNAPVYFLTDELCNAFMKTDWNKIKLTEKP